MGNRILPQANSPVQRFIHSSEGSCVKYDISQDPEYLVMASEIIGEDAFDEETCYSIAIFDDSGEFMAVVVYNNWDHENIAMHIASVSPKWATRDTLRTAFDYAFNHLGVARVSGLVRKSNHTAMDFNHRLGFKIEGKLRDYYGKGEDEVVFGMLKSECRWI